jgi:hypothetical protein
MIENDNAKAGVSISCMAAQCGLSRSRFHQLIGTAFPHPVYDVATRRPFYPPDLQAQCLEVRRRNFGINGKAIIFYSPRQRIRASAPRRSMKKAAAPANNQHDDLLDGLRALGLVAVTAAQVGAALKEIYPDGVNGVEQGEVLRALFLHVRAQGCAR